MSWRVLELSELPHGEHIPQLLVKPVFGPDSYTVHLTCLSNIWCEELDLDGIVDRALQEQSPIEVSKHDTAQLAILLQNIERSLERSDDAVCRLTRSGSDGITLHTSVSLPKPLDSLTWKFELQRRPSTALKNELILPLLVSSHLQHERLASLVSTIREKDKAISRLVDQFESSNLDLASAFPVISGLKSSRKAVKREQAAKHIPALQPFHEETYKQKAGHLVDSDVSTLGLFQEALSECSPSVPPQLKADESDREWWASVPPRLSAPKASTESKGKKPAPAVKPSRKAVESSDDETEDEFETHANFKNRNTDKAPVNAQIPSPPAPRPESSDTETADEDEDLDAPPKSQTQSQRSSQPVRKPPPRAKSPTPEEPVPPQVEASPAAKPKPKGFRIGGRARKVSEEPASVPPEIESQDAHPDTDAPRVEDPEPSRPAASGDAEPKKARRNFKIGGKGKATVGGVEQSSGQVPSVADRTKVRKSPSPSPPRVVKEESPIVEEEIEEAPEGKAERRRAELKRKTEEAAKKAATSKKKRRF